MIKYSSLPPYGRIIYITVVVFLFTQLWKLLTVLLVMSGYMWQDWLALPSNLHDLLLRPWTVLSYMFCHADLSQDPLHIIFNMMWLWWFGQFFMHTHTTRQFVSFYLTSGLAAGLFFVLCYNVFPYFSIDRYFAKLVGASGAIFALMVAVAIRQPEETIGLNLFVRVVWVKMKWFALATLFISFYCLGGNNIGGNVCHIGGALFGLVYGLMEQRGVDICAAPQRLITAIGGWISSLGKPKMKATRGGRRDPISADKKRDMDYNAEKRSREAQIDAILEKISKHGYDGLTAEEKQLLFDASKRRKS